MVGMPIEKIVQIVVELAVGDHDEALSDTLLKLTNLLSDDWCGVP